MAPEATRKLQSQAHILRSGRIVPLFDSTKQSLRLVNNMSLCFQDAAVKRNNNDITEDEYLQALLAHCTGIRHGKNKLCNNDEEKKPGFYRSFFAQNVPDRFTSSIAHWISKDVCKNDTRTINNTTTIFEVLKAYRSDNVAAFKSGLTEMDHAYEALGDRESLSISLCRVLAALLVKEQQEKIELMKAILEKRHTDMGVDFEIGYLHLKKDKKNPRLLRVINSSGYKSQVPRGITGQKALDWYVTSIMFD